MKEQIEQLIDELEVKRDKIYHFIDESRDLQIDIAPLGPQMRILEETIDRLRAILASPDAVSDEKGTTTRD